MNRLSESILATAWFAFLGVILLVPTIATANEGGWPLRLVVFSFFLVAVNFGYSFMSGLETIRALRAVLATTAVLIVATPSPAQTCTSGVCVAPVKVQAVQHVQQVQAVQQYAAPTYVAPVQVQALPAYLMQYDDGGLRQELDAQRLQSAQTEQRVQDLQALVIKLLMDERAQLQARPPQVQIEPQQAPVPLKIQPVTDSPICLPEEIPGFAQTILSNHCGRCHNATVAKGGFQLFADHHGRVLGTLTMAQKDRVLNQLRGGAMPPPQEDHPVSPGGLKLVEAYFRRQ